MDIVIDFLVAPYKNTSFIYILLEFVAAFLGVLSVFYAKKEDIKVYPTGIISTGLYIFLLYRWQLFGDLIINIYYTMMSIYGWYMWARISNSNSEGKLLVSKLTLHDYIISILIFVFSSAFVLLMYLLFDVISVDMNFTQTLHYIWIHISSGSVLEFRKVTPYLDTFTTGAAFAAMWMMANKKLESWILWIAVNIVSIPLYFVKGFGFTGIQYFVFLVLAFLGYKAWRDSLKNNSCLE
ncbi:MAG: nicotinamide riboside transporter PnuC [Bacteroidetes bacterium]|nr:MAG: nicotinamide riboside transporter PnuC [Bacteroidota bacterium]